VLVVLRPMATSEAATIGPEADARVVAMDGVPSGAELEIPPHAVGELMRALTAISAKLGIKRA